MKHVLYLMSLFMLTHTIWAGEAYEAPMTPKAPVIDGVAGESYWKWAPWRNIDKVVLGETPAAEDFSARYKVMWRGQQIFVMAEITDDVLADNHADPLDKYWEDDCFEILIDADHSGGDHTFNNNAYAYHIALDNQAVDLGSDEKPYLIRGHLRSSWRRNAKAPNVVVWEVALTVYDEDKIKTLQAGDVMGFMMAYCDADGKGTRDNFMVDVDVEPVDGDKNRGWIDASVFGDLKLVGAKK